MKKHIFPFLLLASFTSFSQDDDLMKILNENTVKPKQFTAATFKTTRIVNFHTLETVGRRSLDFRISHRFGDINSGAYNAWGIDGGASIRLSLEYSYDGRFMFGIGRTSYEKMVDGFLKYRLLRQTDDNKMPLSVTLFSGAYQTFIREPNQGTGLPNYYAVPTDRLSFCNQIIIGRKFSERFSLQIAPTHIHYNLVYAQTDGNDVFVLASALRFKFTKRQAITLEYGYRLNSYYDDTKVKYYDSFGVGWEIETGGHVFQVHLTNSFGLAENQFYAYTRTSWENFGVRIGFNISRVFTL